MRMMGAAAAAAAAATTIAGSKSGFSVRDILDLNNHSHGSGEGSKEGRSGGEGRLSSGKRLLTLL